MKKTHFQRILVVLVVFGWLVLLDLFLKLGWMERAPLFFGMASALLGLMLSRRLENFSKKNSNKV